MLKYLIEEKSADEHATTDQGETVLLYAASYGEWEVVRFLADTYNIDVECESNNGSTVVSCALQQHDQEAIEWLVDEKDIRIKLTDAVEARSREIVETLIDMITYDDMQDIRLHCLKLCEMETRKCWNCCKRSSTSTVEARMGTQCYMWLQS